MALEMVKDAYIHTVGATELGDGIYKALVELNSPSEAGFGVGGEDKAARVRLNYTHIGMAMRGTIAVRRWERIGCGYHISYVEEKNETSLPQGHVSSEEPGGHSSWGRVKYIRGRYKRVPRKPRHIKHNVPYPPNLLHPCPRVLGRRLPEPEHGGHRAPSVGNKDTVHVKILPNSAPNCRLPINGIVCGVDPRKVRVLHVHEEATALAEVTVEHVPYYLGGALATLCHCTSVGRYLEDEAVVVSDPLLAQALGLCE
ncbi:Sec14p-like phosphatidylinositol transfer family protein [Striga asiatica]|uniref:Sec14p-like phosphatidylinositol transfer family protein n=1 Tax=Striga asiatica TaxID=4170 RepID=A0A5A7QTA6_STRAF|nr:Sec14p-like phosphatidylinositol transfer family protein [Striga asiatica]